jgi:hypothetical protein
MALPKLGNPMRIAQACFDDSAMLVSPTLARDPK